MGRRVKQQSFVFRTWGGKRKGAGRKRVAARPQVPHRGEVDGRTPVHLTLRMLPEIKRLRRREQYRAIREALARTAHRDDCRICQYSVQGNHLHLVAEPRSKESLSRGMMAFKTSCSRHALALRSVLERGPLRRLDGSRSDVDTPRRPHACGAVALVASHDRLAAPRRDRRRGGPGTGVGRPVVGHVPLWHSRDVASARSRVLARARALQQPQSMPEVRNGVGVLAGLALFASGLVPSMLCRRDHVHPHCFDDVVSRTHVHVGFESPVLWPVYAMALYATCRLAFSTHGRPGGWGLLVGSLVSLPLLAAVRARADLTWAWMTGTITMSLVGVLAIVRFATGRATRTGGFCLIAASAGLVLAFLYARTIAGVRWGVDAGLAAAVALAYAAIRCQLDAHRLMREVRHVLPRARVQS